MPYKISGTTTTSGTVIVFDETSRTVVANEEVSSGAYEVTGLSDNNVKIVIARSSEGEVDGYSKVVPISY